MKQLILEIIASVCALCMLAGCAAPAASPGADAGESGPAAGGAGSVQAPLSPGAAGGLRLVTSDTAYFTQSPGTENGWYYIDRGATYNANLRYIDYATAQDIYLSSRPEADHLTPEDDSYIASVMAWGEVFPVGDSLFLLRTGSPAASDRAMPDATAAIWRMEPSGARRTELYIGSAAEMLTTAVAADGRSLYVVDRCVGMDSGKPVQSDHLLQIDQQTGNLQDLFCLPDGAELTGAWDDLLVFRTIADEAPTDENGQPAGPPVFRVTYYTYSPSTGEWRELCQWPVDGRCCAHVWNDVLVLGNNAARTVTLLRLSDGSVTAEYPFPDAVTTETTEGYFSFEGCRDGRFLFWDYFAGAIHSVDLATGAWSTVTTLTYMDPDKQDLRPVWICAENTEEFLVCRNKTIITRRYFDANDGSVYEMDTAQPEYALMRKADYWNGVPDYRPVTFND